MVYIVNKSKSLRYPIAGKIQPAATKDTENTLPISFEVPLNFRFVPAFNSLSGGLAVVPPALTL